VLYHQQQIQSCALLAVLYHQQQIQSCAH
jgi:hypothetical protein